MERIVGRARCGSGALGGGPALCVGDDGEGFALEEDGVKEWSGMTTGGESGRAGCVDMNMNIEDDDDDDEGSGRWWKT